MIAMAMVTEHQAELIGDSCEDTQGRLLPEVPPRVYSTQSQNSSANSLSVELTSLAQMNYTELHLMWRRQ